MGRRSTGCIKSTSEYSEELAIVLAGLSGYIQAQYPDDAALKQIEGALNLSKIVMRRTRGQPIAPLPKFSGGYCA